ncbi:type II/IV secretion system ATPase subunit [Candidatus Micrarchaeota archaeon]|nr:type II/IV secretion system ATPase subunit [Candidatus Micrarchaeota archaeon]
MDSKKEAGGKKAGAAAKEQDASGRSMEKEVARHSYALEAEDIVANVNLITGGGVPEYSLEVPKLAPATRAFVEDVIKPELLKKIRITTSEAIDIKMAGQLKRKVEETAENMIREKMPHSSPENLNLISGTIIIEMLGLGDLEFLLRDDWIEEICVNGAQGPVWVYHKQHGWMKSNIRIPSEQQIWNYSSAIARGVGRQINTQTPLLDAYLPSGDRVNATLTPISSSGNTITIRKFARKPWTITDYIKRKTLSAEVAALLWLATQYESNIIISGGTGTGKTSTLNMLTVFIPQNQRVVSIEQTKEMTLPSYLQWVPMIVREATGEGRGSVSMLDLMVNSLRMRPDRIMVGEIRRAEEAQVLFEAMHTGHSVYATLHAETVHETLRRLTNPPINTPQVMMESLHLIITMYRDRRSGIRRVFEVGEIVATPTGVKANVIYRWKAGEDKTIKAGRSRRIIGSIKTYTNMSEKDIAKELSDRKEVLEWLVRENINTVDKVGEVISRYVVDKPAMMKMVRSK